MGCRISRGLLWLGGLLHYYSGKVQLLPQLFGGKGAASRNWTRTLLSLPVQIRGARWPVVSFNCGGFGEGTDWKWLLSWGISHIEVGVDSQVLVHSLKSTDCPILPLGTILQDIDFYFSHFDCLHFDFCPRVTIAVAHRLVQFGLSSLSVSLGGCFSQFHCRRYVWGFSLLMKV